MQKTPIFISIIAIIGLLSYITYDQFVIKNESQPKFSPTLFTTQEPEASSDPVLQPTPAEEKLGMIEGSISFPSEGIPDDLIVCAETIEGIQIKCTNERINDPKYTYRVGYKMELPVGKYYVYSQLPSRGDNYKAYYNEFVTCGLSINCTSHKNIVVEVKAGETTNYIDPHDWYNGPYSNQ